MIAKEGAVLSAKIIAQYCTNTCPAVNQRTMGSSSSTSASSEPTRGTSDGPAGAPVQKEPTPDLSHAVAPPPLTATLPTGDETASKKLENPGDFEELGKRVKGRLNSF